MAASSGKANRPDVLGAIRLYHVGSYGYGWEDAGGEVKRYGTFHFRLSGQQAAGGRQDG